jgi:putative nucleotidyltransferase with HDIG domain
MIEVSKLLDNTSTSANELGKLVAKDQGLVAKILSVANSPLYGLPRKVSTIDFAIIILGFEHLKDIVMALTVLESLKGPESPRWDRKAYWIHSLMVASASKRIADDIGYQKSGEAFTAGLLHDLGIAVIQRNFIKEFNTILDLVEKESIPHLEAEVNVMGVTHQEIGDFLSDKWKLPETLTKSIANHHYPLKSVNQKLSAIVHLADYMTYKFQLGNISWDDNFVLDEGIVNILNLHSLDRLENFVNSFEELFKIQLDSINHL